VPYIGLVARLVIWDYRSKIAIKMSRPSNKAKSDEAERIFDDSDSEMSSELSADDEDGHSHREETPDLYRNSSLGMCVPIRLKLWDVLNLSF
jgi:hypothetical protein